MCDIIKDCFTHKRICKDTCLIWSFLLFNFFKIFERQLWLTINKYVRVKCNYLKILLYTLPHPYLVISEDCSQKFNGIHLLLAYVIVHYQHRNILYFQCAFKLKLKMWYLLFLNWCNNVKTYLTILQWWLEWWLLW